MKTKTGRTVIAVGVALAHVTEIAVAFVQITRDVSTSVNVQLLPQDGIEIYLDESLTEVADSVDFGVTTVDVFGTSSGVIGVPVWVKNRSLSRIRVSLSDDFVEADVNRRDSPKSCP